MMTLSRTNKILLAVLVAAAAAGAYWFMVLSPQRAKATQLQSDIAAKQASVAQVQQQIAGYEKARTEYKANYARFARVGKAVPGDDDIRSLLVQLDSASSKSKVGFDTVDVGGGSSGSASAPTPKGAPTTLAKAPGLVPIGSSGVSALPFTLSFDGSFFNLTSFFNRLEHFVSVRNEKVKATGRLLRIETLSLTPGAKGWPQMKAAVGAASYVIDPVGVSGSGSAATPASTAAATTPASTSGGSSPSTTTATAVGVGR
jgi:Type II secretion system (T2SS), protein M